MKNILLLISYLLTFSSVYSQSYRVGDTMNVVALDGLNIRLEPSIKAEKIGRLEIGDQVVIIETESRRNDSNFGFTGDWIEIKSCRDSLAGYIFDAFVSQFPVILEMVIFGDTVKNNEGLINGDNLLEVLKTYSLLAFKSENCKSTYYNGSGGTGSRTLNITNLENGHKLITHFGRESLGTELELKNARPSEIYYLVLHLLDFISKSSYAIDDSKLRLIQYSPDPCVEIYPQVKVLIIQKEDGYVSIYIDSVTS